MADGDKAKGPHRLVSLRDVAAACGVSPMAVSLALRGSPEVSEATRQRLQAAAEKLGYRRDPLIADLAVRRWRTRPGAVPLPLAYVFDLAGKTRNLGGQYEHDIHFHSAAASANRYGYRVEEFNLGEYPSVARAARALYTRNYRGLLIGRILNEQRALDLPWERFTAVGCGVGLVRPPVHVVTDDLAAAAWMATTHALERGYRRPGYVHLHHTPDEPVPREYLGGFRAACEALPAEGHLPVHVGQFHQINPLPEFVKWLRTHEPDVVIGFNDLVGWWLRAAGLRVPEDMPFVSLSTERSGDPRVTGIVQPRLAVAAAAVELLIGQIHLNARGIPNPLQTIEVEPAWQEGAMLPRALARRPIP